MSAVSTTYHKQARRFLELLHSSADPEHFIGLFTMGEKDVRPRTSNNFLSPSELDAAAEWVVQQSSAGRDVFGRLGTLRSKPTKGRGTDNDTVAIPGVWLDIDVGKEGHPPDIKTAFRLLHECMPLWPTMIICSGGGLHAYWLLNEPMQPDEARETLTSWGSAMTVRFADRGYKLDSVWDLSRVMRVPGSQNNKPEVNKQCFIFGDYGRLYNLDDLEPYLSTEEIAEHSESPVVVSSFKAGLQSQAALVAEATEGERNKVLFKAACACAGAGNTEPQVIEALTPAALSTGLKLEEINETIRKGFAKGSAGAVSFESVSAAELGSTDFEPLKWAVPGIIPEGLTLFGGKPKTGKSWMMLRIALAVAMGGRTIGNIEVERRGVVYFALEDSHRRLKSRLLTIHGDKPLPDNLHFITRLYAPKSQKRSVEQIPHFIQRLDDVGFVVIDTLGRARDASSGDNYQSDTDFMAPWQEWAHELGVAVVMIHHLRKSMSLDPFDEFSGTLGLTGVCDTLIHLGQEKPEDAEDKPEEMPYVLSITGRDVREQTLVLVQTEDIGWDIASDVATPASDAQRETMRLLKRLGPLAAKTIAGARGKDHSSVYRILNKMLKEGIIQKRDGKYEIRPRKVQPAQVSKDSTHILQIKV